MKKIIFAFVLFGALVATDNVFAQNRADKFKKVEGNSQVTDVTSAPDKIVIGGTYSYTSIDQVYNAFKNHAEHKNDKNFTLANLKKWNSGKTVKSGTEIWLVEPKKGSGLK